MEESCSRGILSSIENVDIERVRPKNAAEDLSSYVWHDPHQELEARRRHTEKRRDELLQLLYQEGLTTEQVQDLVKEWVVLVVERDRLFREQLEKENSQDKAEYLHHLKQMLRTRPSFGDGSEEVNIREALLNLEAHVAQYCTRHDIVSPQQQQQQQTDRTPFRLLTDAPHSSAASVSTIHTKPAQPDTLDMETGQTGIPGIVQPHPNGVPTQHSFVEENDGPFKSPNHNRSTTPHPPVPVKPQKLQKKFIGSPRGKSQNKRITTKDNQTSTERTTTVSKDGDSPITPCLTTAEPQDIVREAKDVSLSQHSQASCSNNLHVSRDPMSSSRMESNHKDTGHPHSPTSITSTHLTPPPPPPLPVTGTHLPSLPPYLPMPSSPSHGAMGTVQFSGPRRDPPGSPEEPQDPPLELPSSEERKSLLDEISSVGQTILRRTHRARTPGGTPAKLTKNRLTLTGNTDMLQRALISKFRTFHHSTPIRKPHTSDQSDSLDASSTWSDINGSMVFEDPDLTTTPSSGLVVSSNCSEGSKVLECDPNISTAV